MPARHDIASERELRDTYAESTKDKALEADPVFCWTQYTGHGPGPAEPPVLSFTSSR